MPFSVGPVEYIEVVERLGMGQDKGKGEDANGCKKIDLVCQRLGASGVSDHMNWASWVLGPGSCGQRNT